MFVIVTDSRRTYHGMVDRVEAEGPAEVVTLDPSGGWGIPSKLTIARQLVSPKLLSLRGRWSSDDVVLVIAWYTLPLLALMKLGYLPRPRRLVSMAAFVHSPRMRQIINALLRPLVLDQLEFIVFSEDEAHNLVQAVRMPAARVHRIVYRGRLEPEVEPTADAAPYVFTGGYSNRDYDTFFAAVRGLSHAVVAVASSLNQLPEPPPNLQVLIDLPWDDFERKLADSRVVVLPLRASGEASGQNVLMRALRYLRPVIATRHDALVDYLGADYPGFVPAENPAALRDAIERAMTEPGFSQGLVDALDARRTALMGRGAMADDVLAVLRQPVAS